LLAATRIEIAECCGFGFDQLREQGCVPSMAGVCQQRLPLKIRSHDAVILVFDQAGNVIGTHEQAGEFKEW
jgi:hypothetical protein